MTDKKQPNEIVKEPRKRNVPLSELPNAVDDPQVMMRLRKKRHLSGLMCPPAPFLSEASKSGKER